MGGDAQHPTTLRARDVGNGARPSRSSASSRKPISSGPAWSCPTASPARRSAPRRTVDRNWSCRCSPTSGNGVAVTHAGCGVRPPAWRSAAWMTSTGHCGRSSPGRHIDLRPHESQPRSRRCRPPPTWPSRWPSPAIDHRRTACDSAQRNRTFELTAGLSSRLGSSIRRASRGGPRSRGSAGRSCGVRCGGTPARDADVAARRARHGPSGCRPKPAGVRATSLEHDPGRFFGRTCGERNATILARAWCSLVAEVRHGAFRRTHLPTHRSPQMFERVDALFGSGRSNAAALRASVRVRQVSPSRGDRAGGDVVPPCDGFDGRDRLAGFVDAGRDVEVGHGLGKLCASSLYDRTVAE